VHIPGYTGRILGSYLHDMFQSWHSSFVAMTQLENHMLQPCLTVSTPKIFGLFNLNINSLPMGVIALFETSFAFFYVLRNLRVSSGARPALPMGVAPEAIVENMF
jgi:hypothetical protein